MRGGLVVGAALLVLLSGCGATAAPRDAPEAREFLERQFGDVAWYGDIASTSWEGSTLVVVADVSQSDAQGICTALTFHDFTPDKVRVEDASGSVLAKRDETNVPCTR